MDPQIRIDLLIITSPTPGLRSESFFIRFLKVFFDSVIRLRISEEQVSCILVNPGLE